MCERERELIALVLAETGIVGKGRANTMSSYFEGTQDFLTAPIEKFQALTFASGRRILNADDIKAITEVRSKRLIKLERPLPDNFIAAISRNFTKRQVDMLRCLTLDSLNPNPFLIQSLNLDTPEEVVRINVYAAATRSIVTSFGLIVQNMLYSTSDTVEKVKSGFDLLKKGQDGSKHWVQVKSGPNDMDKDQVIYWKGLIEEVERRGDRGYIGITYGKKDNKTVTLGLLDKYLPSWEIRTLIGRELWDFLSGDPDLHSRVLSTLKEQAVTVLNGGNIMGELENCVQNVLNEFLGKYGGGKEGVKRYIDDIF